MATLLEMAREVRNKIGGEAEVFVCPRYAVIDKGDGKPVALHGPESKRNWRKLNRRIIDAIGKPEGVEGAE
jgi:hypothetical protein